MSPDQPPSIVAQTERLVIRPPVEGDREAFLAARGASRAELEPWEPRFPFDSFGDAAFTRVLERSWIDSERRLLLLRAKDDVMVGYAGVTSIERGVFQNGRLGWWGVSAHAGNGYMTEGLLAIMRWLFTVEGLHRIEANVQPTNAKSIALAQRLGMRRVGFSEKYVQIAGKWADHEHWAVTIEEWRDGELAP